MSVSALVLSAVLGFASAVISPEIATDTDLAWKAFTGAVANLLLLVAVMSGVGAIVLSGVRQLLHRFRTRAPL
nr:hypothetical protein GCM10025699_09930 [Microbacterium flavescens]